jgi:hypothetical protein
MKTGLNFIKEQRKATHFNPPEADKGLIPRRLRRYNAFVDTPRLCGGAVHCLQGISMEFTHSVFLGTVQNHPPHPS